MGSQPSRNFYDLPDSTKASTAKGVDDIIRGLREYGNIPGQAAYEDEDGTWLLPSEDDTGVGNRNPAAAGGTTVSVEGDRLKSGPQMSAASEATAASNINGVEANELDRNAGDISPTRTKPKNGKSKGAAPVVVAHAESPQTLCSLR